MARWDSTTPPYALLDVTAEKPRQASQRGRTASAAPATVSGSAELCIPGRAVSIS